MADIVLFKPRADGDAKSNMSMFVELCRKLTALDARSQFDQDVWSVGSVFGGNKKFCLHRPDGTPLAEPFRTFIKSYVAYTHSFEPKKSATSLEEAIYAMRGLEEVCRNKDGFEFHALSGKDFDAAIEHFKKGTAQAATLTKRGASLAKIAAFIQANMLVCGPLAWTNPIPKPKSLAHQSSKEGDEARAKKLPSKAAMAGIPQIFYLAHANGSSDNFCQIVTSYCALLMSNPSRAGELLSQPVDILVEGFSGSNAGLGLRWWPEKGGTPLVKPVLGPFEDVVRQAHQSLVRNGSEARVVARWYESNPRKMFLPEGFEFLRNREFIFLQEINDLFFGGAWDPAARMRISSWLKRSGIAPIRRQKRETKSSPTHWVRFADLEASALSALPTDLLSRPSGRKYSEMLFLTLGVSLRGAWCGMRVLFCPISYESIFNGLGGRHAGGTKSIFDHYGFTNDDGSPIAVNTHQFRHWLNTLAQLAGLSQLDIAMWSGRKNVAQNEAYNHVTPVQRLDRLRSLVGDHSKAVGALGSMPTVIPIRRADYAAAKIPTAHVTDFGYCVHDFSFEPCQLHRDCLSCNDHVCVKGDQPAEERLTFKLEETRRLLESAKNALSEDEYGADQWVRHNEAVLGRLTQLKAVLADPAIEDGAIIQLANPTAPSRLKEALASRVRLDLPPTTGDVSNAQENADRIKQIKSDQGSKS